MVVGISQIQIFLFTRRIKQLWLHRSGSRRPSLVLLKSLPTMEIFLLSIFVVKKVESQNYIGQSSIQCKPQLKHIAKVSPFSCFEVAQALTFFLMPIRAQGQRYKLTVLLSQNDGFLSRIILELPITQSYIYLSGSIFCRFLSFRSLPGHPQPYSTSVKETSYTWTGS